MLLPLAPGDGAAAHIVQVLRAVFLVRSQIHCLPAEEAAACGFA